MREAFKEIQIATSPSDRDCWTISEDRKGIEKMFKFKSFTACWVRLDINIGDMSQNWGIEFLRISHQEGIGGGGFEQKLLLNV